MNIKGDFLIPFNILHNPQVKLCILIYQNVV